MTGLVEPVILRARLGDLHSVSSVNGPPGTEGSAITGGCPGKSPSLRGWNFETCAKSPTFLFWVTVPGQGAGVGGVVDRINVIKAARRGGDAGREGRIG